MKINVKESQDIVWKFLSVDVWIGIVLRLKSMKLFDWQQIESISDKML